MTKIWHVADVTVDPVASEMVESALIAAGALGTEIDSLGSRAAQPVIVTAYFEIPRSSEEIRSHIENELHIFGLNTDVIYTIQLREIPDQDWLAEWKRHWRPTEVGCFVIAPPWSDVAETEKHVIRIEPNMAFGTGTHETTRLCLQAIGKLYQPGLSLLDVGTGTGVLAIAAAKLGGEGDIFAYDTDADSVQIARENAVANDVAGRIRFIDGTINEKTPSCDLVYANLTLDVISLLLPLLVCKAKQYLVLSGILIQQREQIETELEELGVENSHIETDGEWIAVTVCPA